MIGEGDRMLTTNRARCTDIMRDRPAPIPVADGTRLICLLSHEHAQPDDADAWYCAANAVLMGGLYHTGFIARLQLRPTSLYRWAMSVDADSLLLEYGTNVYWTITHPDPGTGNRRMHRQFRKAGVAKRPRQKGASILVRMNSGAFRFNNIEAEHILAGQNDNLRCRKLRGVGLHCGTLAQIDEVYTLLRVDLNGPDCIGRVGENLWGVFNWRAFARTLGPARGIAPGLRGAVEHVEVAFTVGVAAPRRTGAANAAATLVRTADKTPDNSNAASTAGCAWPSRRQLRSRRDSARLFRRDAAAWPDFPMTAAVAFT